jgi:hypothetical protein
VRIVVARRFCIAQAASSCPSSGNWPTSGVTAEASNKFTLATQSAIQKDNHEPRRYPCAAFPRRLLESLSREPSATVTPERLVSPSGLAEENA